jgi:hypothetical protein
MGSCSKDDTEYALPLLGAAVTAGGVAMLIRGLVSSNAITVTTAARPGPGNVAVGFSPRREGGGFLSARFAF